MCQTAFSSSGRVIEESGRSLSGLGETYTNSYCIIGLWFHIQHAGAKRSNVTLHWKKKKQPEGKDLIFNT